MTNAQEERLRALTTDDRLTTTERASVFTALLEFAEEPSSADTQAEARATINHYTALADSRGRFIRCEREPGDEG